MKRLFVPSLILLSCLHVHAEESLPLELAWPGKEFVPAGVKLSLKVAPVAVVGHEIPAMLVVRNEGTQGFKISVGGDYRCIGFPLRVKVRARDAGGNMLPGPPLTSHRSSCGGLGLEPYIEPGSEHEIELPLDCYVSFRNAGVYTVHAGHDLGWKVDPAHPHPVAQVSLKVTMPMAVEAAEYVDDLFASQPPSPKDPSDALERESRMEKSLCVLRHPVYLPALMHHAQAGSKAAVKGIGQIATVEATEALLELLDHTHVGVVQTSLQQIHRRLPKLDAADKPEHPGFWRSPYQIDPLLPASWQPQYETPLVQALLRLLEHESDDVVGLAARLLTSRAKPYHASALLSVLQKCLEAPYEVQSGPKAKTLGLPLPQGSLIEPLDGLRTRGWRLKSGAGDTAHLVAWFRQLADPAVVKPDGMAWKSSMLTWVEKGPKGLKIAALEAIPHPFSAEAVKTVIQAFADEDWGVRRVACEVAGKSGRSEFVSGLVRLVETAHESYLNRAARNAAIHCGAKMEVWEALASTIVVADLSSDALHDLVVGTIELPFSGSAGANGCSLEQSFAIRDAWRAFLRKHRKTLAAGKKIVPSDAATTAALTGAIFDAEHPAVEFKLKDGARWPPMPPRK